MTEKFSTILSPSGSDARQLQLRARFDAGELTFEHIRLAAETEYEPARVICQALDPDISWRDTYPNPYLRMENRLHRLSMEGDGKPEVLVALSAALEVYPHLKAFPELPHEQVTVVLQKALEYLETGDAQGLEDVRVLGRSIRTQMQEHPKAKVWWGRVHDSGLRCDHWTLDDAAFPSSEPLWSAMAAAMAAEWMAYGLENIADERFSTDKMVRSGVFAFISIVHSDLDNRLIDRQVNRRILDFVLNGKLSVDEMRGQLVQLLQQEGREQTGDTLRGND